MWRGKTCAILAGGPSLTQEMVDMVRAHAVPVIAINNAYLLAPWAEVHYFCDQRWHSWHCDKPEFKTFGGIKVTLCEQTAKKYPHLKWQRNMTAEGDGSGIWPEPDGLATGRNAGYQAINLAIHFAAARIVLLGYDMKRGPDGEFQWHSGHEVPNDPDRPCVYQNVMLPAYPKLVAPLAERGIEVINATPGSELDVFPKMELANALCA